MAKDKIKSLSDSDTTSDSEEEEEEEGEEEESETESPKKDVKKEDISEVIELSSSDSEESIKKLPGKHKTGDDSL